MRTLKLTSPFTTGPDVARLQKALGDYLQGSVDGEFGPDTSRAVYRAKYWLGYANPNHTAGTALLNLLEGKRQPNAAMKKRITARKKAAAKKPIRLKMLAEAKKWVGTKESPAGSNRVKFSLWYGMIGPWCAMFVTWCGVSAGSKAFKRSVRYAYVPYMLADAKAGSNNLTITYYPQPGDLVLFDWDDDSVADHIELFEKWLTKNQSKFASYGGNTSGDNSGSQSNGGAVVHREKYPRYKNDVIAFVHVGA